MARRDEPAPRAAAVRDKLGPGLPPDTIVKLDLDEAARIVKGTLDAEAGVADCVRLLKDMGVAKP